MRRRAWPAVHIATLFLAATLGCAGEGGETADGVPAVVEPTEEPLPPLELPDVSGLAESVQAQVRERYASLEGKLDAGGVSDAVLADAYGDAGLILMATEYHAAAELGYRHAAALAPDDMRWPYYLGHLHRLTGDAAAAAAAFERTLDLSPDHEASQVWLGETYLDRGDPDAAERLFASALRRQPDSAAALAGVGRAALAREDYTRAADFLRRALDADPAATSLHYPIGLAYRGLGEIETAAAHLARRGTGPAAPVDPLMEHYRGLLESAMAYEAQGLEAFRARRWVDAAEAFRQGLALEPDNPALRHRLGSALLMTGDTAGARQEFEDTLRRAPEFARAHFSLGVMLDSEGRYRQAADRFAAAVQHEPTHVEARMGLAESLRVTGRREEAVERYSRLVEIDPGFLAGWIRGADVLVQLEQYEEADVWLREASDVHPGRPEIAGLAEAVTAILALRRGVAR